jgi:hypothetical protein
MRNLIQRKTTNTVDTSTVADLPYTQSTPTDLSVALSWKTNGIFEDSEDSEDEEKQDEGKPAADEAQSPCSEDDRKPPAVESWQTNGIFNDSEDEQKPAAEEVELPFTQSKPNDLSVPNAWKTNGIYNPWLQWGMNIQHGSSSRPTWTTL